MAAKSYDYADRQGVLSITWSEFHGICRGMARAAARFQPELILPVGRGGYYPGTLLAHMLQTELYPIRLSRRVADRITYQEPRWLVRPPGLVSGRRVLVVDEIASTGETIELVRKELSRLGAGAVCSAVLVAHTAGTPVVDIAGLITDALVLNPWDREIFVEGAFVLNPEYRQALGQQGLAITAGDLVTDVEMAPAKEIVPGGQPPGGLGAAERNKE